MHKKISTIIICILTIFNLSTLQSASIRTPLFSNQQVHVWKTIIYPNKKNMLSLHRHEKNRVLVALNSGTLKIVTKSQETSLLKLKKNQAYFLKMDPPQTYHTDENISSHPLEVIVIELEK